MTTDGPRGDVGVVGTGAMGAGIAQVAAVAGHDVYLHDIGPNRAAAAAEGLAQRLTDLAAKDRMTADAARAAADRLHVVADLADLPPCELVVEAAIEDLAVKRSVFTELGRLQAPTTLLATNTSSLDIDAIAEAVHDPERVLGLHFFNPAPVMRLVEVVHGSASAQTYLDFAADLVASWGKTPVHCASTPGFIVNRVARPFYGEGQRMLQEGLADAATIDACLRSAGFRMGPLELTDLIGQDVNLAVGTSVWERTGNDPRYAPVQLQRDLVAEGRLGFGGPKLVLVRPQDRARDLRVCVGRSPDGCGTGRAPGRRAGRRTGPHRPGGPDRRHARQRGRRPRPPGRGHAGGRRHRHGPRNVVPQGPDRVGPRAGARSGPSHPRGARRRIPRWPVPPEPGPGGRLVSAQDLTHVRRMWADDGASAHLGMDATLIEVDHAVVRMPVGDRMVNGHDLAHGGYLFTLADSAFALACNSRGELTVAAGADIVFVASARLGDVLVAEARVRTAYGRSGITDVTVTRESDGAVIAEFRGRSRSLPSR